MKETGLKADGSLAGEAKRRLENRVWSYEQTRGEREEFLAEAKADADAFRLFEMFSSMAGSLLLIGQGRFRLAGDTDGARATFRELESWFSFFAEGADMSSRASNPPMDSSNLLEPIICLALGGMDDLMFKVAEAAESNIFAMPRRAPKSMLLASRFSIDLASCIRPASVSELPYKANAPIPAGHSFHGYDRLLQPLADRNSSAFKAACAPLEQRFVSRAQQRDDSLNWCGYGRLAQTACFDALGTAVLRVARLRGLKVEGESLLYPRAFIS